MSRLRAMMTEAMAIASAMLAILPAREPSRFSRQYGGFGPRKDNRMTEDSRAIIRNYEADLAFWYSQGKCDKDVYYKTCQMINKIYDEKEAIPDDFS
jgi:hypothetical protein